MLPALAFPDSDEHKTALFGAVSLPACFETINFCAFSGAVTEITGGGDAVASVTKEKHNKSSILINAVNVNFI